MPHTFTELLTMLEHDIADHAFSAYGPRPIPHALDRKIKTLIESFLASEETGKSLLSCLPAKACQVLLAFAERQASYAIRTGSASALPAAVIAIGLAASIGGDEREGVLVMPLPWRAATLLGVHQEKLFTSAASKVPEPGAKALTAFMQRRPEEQRLDSMGYVEGADADGFRFMRKW